MHENINVKEGKQEKMFINFSNHLSDKWQRKQIDSADIYGEIMDIPFPMVPATTTSEEIKRIAVDYAKKILEMKPDVVMVQGEFTLTYAVIELLKKENIRCVAACSDRVTKEIILKDGNIQKESIFEFVQFREY